MNRLSQTDSGIFISCVISCFQRVSFSEHIFHALAHDFKPLHDKTNKMACVPSEDSDQPNQSLRCPHEDSLGP